MRVKNFRVFYTENDSIISLGKDDKRAIIEKRDNRSIKEFNYFESMKGFKANRESLIEFRDNFISWIAELKNEGIEYTNYFNHFYATYFTFLRYSTNNMKKINKLGFDAIPNINFIEYKYYEKCYNASLMSFDEQYLNKQIQCYSYDFSAYYPHILAKFDFQMPIKEGKQHKILDFKKQLKYGIYHVKITCQDKNFKKIFAFSKNDYYTHYSINFALKHKKQYNITLEIQGIDQQYNCIVYEKEDLVYTREIFLEWFEKMIEIKKKYPTNKLVKNMMSSIWGCLIQFERVIIKTDEDLEDYDASDILTDEKTEYKILEIDPILQNNEIIYNYKLIKSDCAYKRPFRIKPFLTAYARRQIAEFVLQENLINDLVRVQTDSVTLTKEYDFTHLPYYPKLDLTHTGSLTWLSTNSYSVATDD